MRTQLQSVAVLLTSTKTKFKHQNPPVLIKLPDNQAKLAILNKHKQTNEKRHFFMWSPCIKIISITARRPNSPYKRSTILVKNASIHTKIYALYDLIFSKYFLVQYDFQQWVVDLFLLLFVWVCCCWVAELVFWGEGRGVGWTAQIVSNRFDGPHSGSLVQRF